MKDTIVRTFTKPAVDTYTVVKCGRCAGTFTTSGEFRTARCPYCQRVCRLDTADRPAETLPGNVVQLFGRPA